MNYIQENSQNKRYGADCQLVVAVNAYQYLTGNIIEKESGIYRDLAEIAGCVHGSCIDIKKVWKRLGIWEDQKFSDKFELKDVLFEGCFFEASIWHQRYGFHSVSIVDYSKKSNSLQVLNFKYETTTQNWIFWEDFQHFLVKDPSNKEWVARSFTEL